jgi:hypothetical protein
VIASGRIVNTNQKESRMRRRQRAVLGLVCVALVNTPLVAQSWNLAADWSDLVNPFGPWSLFRAPGSLFPINQSDWWSNGTNQKAWADQPFNLPTHVPVWMKVSWVHPTLSTFATPGTVIMHSAETRRTGTELSSVAWTSPVGGIATVGGGVWLKKPSTRPQLWELFLNGVSLSLGALSHSDLYTQDNPFLFATGSGGAGAMTFAVQPGDEVRLTIRRQPSAPFGDFVGMDFGIDVTPSVVPEPSSMLLLASGLFGVAAFGRRWSRRGRMSTSAPARQATTP